MCGNPQMTESSCYVPLSSAVPCPSGSSRRTLCWKQHFFLDCSICLHSLASLSYGSICERALTRLFSNKVEIISLSLALAHLRTRQWKMSKCNKQTKFKKEFPVKNLNLKSPHISPSSLKDTTPCWIIKLMLDSLLSSPKREILNCRSLARQILLQLCLFLVVPLTWTLCLFLVVPNYFLYIWQYRFHIKCLGRLEN